MSIVYFDEKSNNGITGTVRFTSLPSGRTRVSVDLSGLEPLTAHAIHIHEKGDLSKGCMGTGGHWNPCGTTHGSYLFPERPKHMGDLMNNLFPDRVGKARVEFDDIGYRPEHVLGRAVVVHSLEDDLGLQGIIESDGSFTPYDDMSKTRLAQLSRARKYPVGSAADMKKKLNEESLKTGNAGGRMACGVIGIL